MLDIQKTNQKPATHDKQEASKRAGQKEKPAVCVPRLGAQEDACQGHRLPKAARDVGPARLQLHVKHGVRRVPARAPRHCNERTQDESHTRTETTTVRIECCG
jgi:hypothetical protein